jgi:hypothetical protein
MLDRVGVDVVGEMKRVALSIDLEGLIGALEEGASARGPS